MNPSRRLATELLRFGARRIRWTALAACLAAGSAAAAPDRAALLALSATVLKIEVIRTDGSYSLGSGVVVATDKVATNCHVTRDGVQIHVMRGGVRWPVSAQAADVNHDLCVLQVPDLEAQPVALAAPGPKIGQSVTALGFTGGLGIQLSAGEVVALHRFDGGEVIQSTNWFSSGASGGGLFDDDLHLVGILTFRLRGGAAHYFASPVTWLGSTLNNASAFHPVAPWPQDGDKTLPYWQLPVAKQPRFLQAGVLERDRDWAGLDRLATDWLRADSTDAQAWYAQGLARQGLDRLDDAQRAFEHALVLAPDSREAWFQLGLLAVRQGRLDRAREARQRLDNFHSDLAAKLGQALDGR